MSDTTANASLPCSLSRSTRCDGKLQKVLPQIIRLIDLGGLIEKDPAKLLTRSQDLSAPRESPTRICRSEVKQLERAIESAFQSVVSAFVAGAQGSAHFAADIPELLGQRERLPPARG